MIAGRKALGERDDVRHDTFLFIGKQATGPTGAAHYFVENQMYAITIADFANSGEVTRDGGCGADGSSHHRFRDEARYIFRPKLLYLCLKLIGSPQPICLATFIAVSPAVFKAR